MLALRTGWTPDVMAELAPRFHAAVHWAMYAEAICGAEGLPPTEITGGSMAERQAALRRNAALLPLRALLFPGGE